MELTWVLDSSVAKRQQLNGQADPGVWQHNKLNTIYIYTVDSNGKENMGNKHKQKKRSTKGTVLLWGLWFLLGRRFIW